MRARQWATKLETTRVGRPSASVATPSAAEADFGSRCIAWHDAAAAGAAQRSRKCALAIRAWTPFVRSTTWLTT